MRTLIAACSFLSLGLPAQQADKLVVHEWGTFTVLQDERGVALPGVNINEETLPAFVHRLSGRLSPDSHDLAPLLHVGTHAGFQSKGLPRSCPAAHMRMETPILYFYPPTYAALPLTIDVRVDFYRGWISEWYPDAKCVAPGFEKRQRPMRIDPGRNGSITWNGLKIGSKKLPPKTSSKVWLAPRIPRPASVETPNGQVERYLFYRGIADLRAPLRVTREARGEMLCVKANQRDVPTRAPFRYAALWLADIRGDGKVAFRVVPGFTAKANSDRVHARIKGRFAAVDYTSVGRRNMRRSMAKALGEAGLFEAEAKAMLDTWEFSYFKSPGLRLFFVLPREWIDAVLPLRISRRASTARVMIGRIELITVEQRAMVRALANLEAASSPAWFYQAIQKLPPAQRNAARMALVSGKQTLAQLGIEAPADYALYLKLGRFRDALVLDENRRRSTPTLAAFVNNYHLNYFHQPAAASTGGARRGALR